jgi:hypothetical protein
MKIFISYNLGSSIFIATFKQVIIANIVSILNAFAIIAIPFTLISIDVGDNDHWFSALIFIKPIDTIRLLVFITIKLYI